MDKNLDNNHLSADTTDSDHSGTNLNVDQEPAFQDFSLIKRGVLFAVVFAIVNSGNIRELYAEGSGNTRAQTPMAIPLGEIETPSAFVDQANLDRLRDKLKEYGIIFKYNKIPVLSRTGKAKLPSMGRVNEQLTNLLKELEKYPFAFYENLRAKPIEIFFVEDLKQEDGTIFEGEASRAHIVLNIDLDIDISVWHHEFFHTRDYRDDYNGNGKPTNNENPNWIKRHHKGRNPYVHNRYGDKPSSCIEKTEDKPVGFSSSYGKCYGPNEDQAGIAEDLFVPERKKDLLGRAKTDSILRQKIEMITGCLIDPQTATFTRTLTLAEYKKKFGSGYQYYPKWSLHEGKVQMDANYWNNLK